MNQTNEIDETDQKEQKQLNVAFFENYSIMTTLFLLPFLKKAEAIYFQIKPFPGIKINQLSKKIVLKILRLIKCENKIAYFDEETLIQHNWESNDRAVRLLKTMEENIRQSKAYESTYKIINDHNIIKFYQSNLVTLVAGRMHYIALAKDLYQKSGKTKQVVLLPEPFPSFKETDITIAFDVGSVIIPKIILRINRLRRLIATIFYFCAFIFTPMIFLIEKINKVGNINKKVVADIAIPVLWCMQDRRKVSNDKKVVHSDDLLYGEQIQYGSLVHIFDNWKKSDKDETEAKATMTRLGIPYAVAREYKIGYSLLLSIFRLQIRTLLTSIRFLDYLHCEPELMASSFRIIRRSLYQLIEFDNVDYKVYLRRDDYSAPHIMSTIMCEKAGKKVVLTYHHGSTFDVPSLAFIHANKYIVHGAYCEQMMKPFWEGVNIARTGRENIDWVVSIDKNNEYKLKKLFMELYGDRRFLITIIFPGFVSFSLKQRWHEMYEALALFTKNDIDASIVLRFRSKPQFDESDFLQKFKELAERDSRIVIDFVHFSTHELMAISDVIIAHSASFSVNEALASKAKVFIFDFLDVSKYYFSEYGKDLILYDRYGLMKVFQGLDNNYNKFDCKWDELKKDFNYHYDGKNTERIRQVLLGIMEDV